MVVEGVEVRRTERPTEPEELARILAEAVAAGAAVVPVGGGRALGMGGIPEAADLALETAGLDRVLEHAPHDLTVTVEAGVTLEVLQEQLAVAGQFLPLDPFNSPGHTIGGLLASGWAGPLRLRYGSAREFLIGLRVALPDGKLARSGGKVVKNVSGYDLNKLHLGALGTLGVIVEATFKVFPKPLAEATLEATFPDRAMALEAAGRALGAAMPPAALDLIAENGGHRLLVRVSGTPGGVRRITRELGWPEVEPQVWDEHRRRGSDRWVRVSARSGALSRLLDALPAGANYVAHAGSGIVHWFDATPDGLATVRAAAEAEGGSAVILAGPAELKQVGAWGARPPTAAVMEQVRAAFDPGRRMNPGRYVL